MNRFFWFWFGVGVGAVVQSYSVPQHFALHLAEAIAAAVGMTVTTRRKMVTK